MRILNGLKIVSALVTVSGMAGADINFDGQLVPATDIQSISILPASGDLNIITTPGYTVTRNSTTPPTPGTAAISGFSASPATITEGQTTTISWTTVNAVSCKPTGGAGGWGGRTIGPASGSTSVTIANAGTYTFTLTCAGASGNSVVRRTGVTVTTPANPVSSSCTKNPSPLAGITTTWQSLWGVEFPGPRYDNKEVIVPRSGYLAYEFNTGDVDDDGKLVTVGNTKTPGVRTGTISECPGDFTVASECTKVWGLGGALNWATNGAKRRCQLKPATTYYFNVTFTDGVDPKSSTCKTATCYTTLQTANF